MKLTFKQFTLLVSIFCASITTLAQQTSQQFVVPDDAGRLYVKSRKPIRFVDVQGHVVTKIENRGRTTYQWVNNVRVSRTLPNGVMVQYVRDAEGRLIQTVASNGIVTNVQRDSSGKVSGIVGSNGWALNINPAGESLVLNGPNGYKRDYSRVFQVLAKVRTKLKTPLSSVSTNLAVSAYCNDDFECYTDGGGGGGDYWDDFYDQVAGNGSGEACPTISDLITKCKNRCYADYEDDIRSCQRRYPGDSSSEVRDRVTCYEESISDYGNCSVDCERTYSCNG